MFWSCQLERFQRFVLKRSVGKRFTNFIYIIHLCWCIGMGSWGGFGSCNIRPPHPNDPVGIDLTPTPIPAANLRIHKKRKKMTTEMALYIILQQPIRAKLFWWLLNLSFKIGRPLYSCFFATMTSLFGYLFTPVCISSFFFIFLPPFFYTYRKKIKWNKKNKMKNLKNN